MISDRWGPDSCMLCHFTHASWHVLDSPVILCYAIVVPQGFGIDEILEAIVKRVPPPKDTYNERLRALIFDSYYDPYKV